MAYRILAFAVGLWGLRGTALLAQDLSAEDQLSRNRAVSFSSIVLIDAFLGTGERRPEKELEYLGVNINNPKEFGREGLKLLHAALRLRQVCLGDDFPEEWCADLAKLTQIEGLYFAGSKFSLPPEKSGMAEIGKMRQLQALSLLSTRIDDKRAMHLSALVKLRYLCLHGTNITDDGLSFVREMTELENIDLIQTNVSGEGLRHLSKAAKLRRIRVVNEKGGLSREILKQLAAMPNLRELVGRGNVSSDDDLRLLMRAAKLETLDLSYCGGISDDGVRLLASLSNLQRLDLCSTGITGKTLPSLTGLKKLSELSLSLTSVDDTVIDAVLQMPQLRNLELARTNVTEAKIESIKKKMPKLNIDY